jgi:hypothetical protein
LINTCRFRIVVDPLFNLTAGVPITMFGAYGTYQYFSVFDALLFKQSIIIEVAVEGAGDPDLYLSQDIVYATATNTTLSSAKAGAESLFLNVSTILSIPVNIGVTNYVSDA